MSINLEARARIKNQEFLDAIAFHLNDVRYFSVGIDPDCPDCPEYMEGDFSWQHCDSCGSHLGGDRFPAHGEVYTPEGWVDCHFDICSDCLNYHANGELPW